MTNRYEIMKYIGIGLLAGGAISAIKSNGGDSYLSATLAQEAIGVAMYLGAYLGEVKDSLRNLQKGKLEKVVEKE